MNRRNFRDRRQNDANAELVNLGTLSHKCGPLFVLKLATTDIPFPNAFVFDENKKQIGKVEEVLGPQTDVYVAISIDQETDEYFIYSNKLIPKSRFLERSETEKKKEAEDKKRKKMEAVKKFGSERRGGDKRSNDRRGCDKRSNDRRGGDRRNNDKRSGDKKFKGRR